MMTSLLVHALALTTVVAAPAGGPPAGGGSSALPIIVDLHKAPVGTWSEYEVTVQGMEKMKQRIALVARGADSATIEMTVEGGQMAMMGGKALIQVTTSIDPKTSGTPKKIVMQMGDGDAMEMPPQAAMGASKFEKVDPKKLGPIETIKVAAGSFKVRKTKDTKNGTVVEAWVGEDVLPLGLVKMVASGAQGPGGQPTTVTLELAATGKGAKAMLTKPAKPFDQAAFMQQMMAAAQSRAGKPPQAAPSPAPAAKPVAPAK